VGFGQWHHLRNTSPVGAVLPVKRDDLGAEWFVGRVD
jgi:hypothetical protein